MTEMMGFPKIEDLSYFNTKSKENNDMHSGCHLKTNVNNKAFLEL